MIKATVTLKNKDNRTFHYVEKFHKKHGSAPFSRSDVFVSEVDSEGKENGLYVRNQFYCNDWQKPYDENAYVFVGTKRDGEISGPLYCFECGDLEWVKADGKIFTCKDPEFGAYADQKPDFREVFDMLVECHSCTAQNIVAMSLSKGRGGIGL